MIKAIFLFLFVLYLVNTAINHWTGNYLDPCKESWKILANPRLDEIADTIADINAKFENGIGTERDAQLLRRLKEEEDKIWRSAMQKCG